MYLYLFVVYKHNVKTLIVASLCPLKVHAAYVANNYLVLKGENDVVVLCAFFIFFFVVVFIYCSLANLLTF